MSLFAFMKNIGADLFGGGNEAEEVEKMLHKELPEGIDDLEVAYDDGAVTLTGSCDSQATKEKAVLLAGNIKGVDKVADENFTAVVAEEETVFYVIEKGDTLSKIAKHWYGDATKYPTIFEANREVIKDADLIYPGQTIRIPKNATSM
ncbi:MAG: peptidoglycan-binding protein LysM [Desulfobacterales bacterium]|nr:peptidoglycan-binding protein LysM [Desulfobacterales bacterium]